LKRLQQLFEKNLQWATAIKAEDPDFFTSLSKQQSPHYLWIGCSDSRVPATQIVDMPPGEIFVHRNIANVVVHTDLNCLSVIQYAVEILKVRHVIVCGHYGCGGIQASMDDRQYGLIDSWLLHIKDVRRMNEQQFEGLSEAEQFKLLCELNVKMQVLNVCDTSIVQNAWRSGVDLTVHGVIYSIENGILKSLSARDANGELSVE
jgi:carbonic anhydrase